MHWRAVCEEPPARFGERSYLGESGCESGEEDAGTGGTLNRAACGPAWLAARRSPGFTVIAGAGMLSGSRCACPGDPGCGGSRGRLCWAAVAGWLCGVAPQ